MSARKAEPSGGALMAWLRLCRAPNVFTALADILAGFMLTHATFAEWPVMVWLCLASCLIYTAGMVLNDVFDIEIDRLERPQRPLPSGRITLAAASGAGFGMLAGGIACAAAASFFASTFVPVLVASALACAVVAYNRLVKQTPLGPANMGLCRGLNLLLGMSAVIPPWHLVYAVPVAGVGIYIAGVTWLARNEAGASRRSQLSGAIATIIMGMAVLASIVEIDAAAWPEVSRPTHAVAIGVRWYYYWGLLAMTVVWRAVWAVVEPSPGRVQTAVKHAILTLIVLDATLAFAARGAYPATAIFALVVPALFLGRWVYST